MKLDELRTVQSKERRKDSLQQLRDSFYEDVAAYIQDLKASRDRRAEQVADPFSDTEVRQLSDELDTAKEVAEAVYERRVGKVVKLASFAAADMPVDDEGMTNEERELFEDLVDRIERNKRTVLDVLSGTSESTEGGEPNPTGDTQPTAPNPSTATDDTGPAAPTPPTERATESGATPDAAEPADSMLADAMGSADESSTVSSSTNSEPSTHPEPPTESEPATEPSTHPEPLTDSEPPTASTPAGDTTPPTESTDPVATEEPPHEPEPEPDVRLGTSTDGGTTTTGSTASEAAAEPPAAAAETDRETTTQPTTDAAGEGADEDRTTLRITRDVGEIFGVDGREYTLRSEDVVTLPTANADPLVDRDAAMRLD